MLSSAARPAGAMAMIDTRASDGSAARSTSVACSRRWSRGVIEDVWTPWHAAMSDAHRAAGVEVLEQRPRRRREVVARPLREVAERLAVVQPSGQRDERALEAFERGGIGGDGHAPRVRADGSVWTDYPTA